MDVQLPDGTIVQNVPDGMTQSQLMAKLGKPAPAETPSRVATFGNAVAKGAAGFGDMIGNGIVNTANLGIAGYGALKGAAGSKDLPDLIPHDALSGYHKIGEATGLINDKREPTDMAGRMIDMTGQVIGGGGVNPAAVARSASRGAITPIVRDLTAATAGGVGAGAGSELTRNVNTGNETLDRAIKLAATMVGGAAPSATLAARGTGGDRAAAAMAGVTPEQIKLAKAIQEQAAKAGTPITGYEAIQAVTGTNPKMQTQQRVTEQSDAAAGGLTPMMQNRPANNAAYFDKVAGGISPAEKFPDVLAGQLQNSATGAIDAARQQGNAQAAPAYAASSNNPAVRIPAHDWNTITTDPAIAWALAQVKKDPLAGMQNATEGSVQWLDAAKKFLDDQKATNKQAGSNFAAKNAGSAASNITGTVDPVVPAYAQARGIVANNMKNVVEPMQNSQVGKLTESNDFRKQASTLLPENPLDVTPAVIDRTVKTLSQQDPEIVKRFVAQYLRGTFNESNGGGVGNNAFGGYQFAKKVADNPQQQENLIQALKTSGANPDQVSQALEIFRAQGMKPGVNSATTANAAESSAMSAKLADMIMRPLKTTGGVIDKWRNGLATKDLAAALSDPKSVDRLQELARQGGKYNPLTQQMLAQMLLASRQNSTTPPAAQ